MRSLALVVTLALAVSGCARFDDRLDAPFTPAPGPGMAAPPPSAPSPPPSSAPSPGEPGTPQETGPCVDPDPAVIATCLDPAVAVAAVGERAIVAEQSGGLTLVSPEAPQESFGRVDPRGGRVVAVAPSPDFDQDRLVYVLVVGDGPTRVERVARDDTPRTVAELPAADSGGLVFVGDVMTVASGGQVLRFPGFTGIGTAGAPEVVAGDVGAVQALCTLDDELFLTSVTDRGVTLRTPERVVWTWPDQRAVGGCAAAPDRVAVALPDVERVDTLETAGGAARGGPEPLAEGLYGRLTGLTMAGEGVLVAGTTNKAGGAPVATDDRAVVLPASGGGGDART